ncbi:MAG: acyl-CoA dehydrogenase family protein [Gammaproteobacteria bacterium]|nr:acyl-CoA/acyl-ACP dehydrogenase [Pseudomonadales bacterium]
MSRVEDLQEIRNSVRRLCRQFPNQYWRELDQQRGYPDEFIRVLTEQGYLSVLIPEQYGGAGLGVSVAGAILEEISRSGGHPGAFHAQMYTMGTLLRHGSSEQKERYLPAIASGELTLQAFAVTEPAAGTDTTSISTFAENRGDHYLVNGRKIWISRAAHSDLLLLLARTRPLAEVSRKTDGLSVFLVDMRELRGRGLTIKPIETMMNHHTTELFFEDMLIPADSLVGEEHQGFRTILDGMNAERILIAYECLGDSKFFIERASAYATDREVFGRAIGRNQGVQFPIARVYTNMRAAELMTWKAAELFDAGEPCAAEANMAKLLASEVSWEAGDVCLQTHGGYGFAREFDIERKLRETRLYQVAPISTNLILSYLGEHVLGMPRSY